MFYVSFVLLFLSFYHCHTFQYVRWLIPIGQFKYPEMTLLFLEQNKTLSQLDFFLSLLLCCYNVYGSHFASRRSQPTHTRAKNINWAKEKQDERQKSTRDRFRYMLAYVYINKMGIVKHCDWQLQPTTPATTTKTIFLLFFYAFFCFHLHNMFV